MKKTLTFVLLLTASFLSAQSNDSLTMNEAYNYSVGDTFQYRVYDRGSSIYRFKPQQIVIKEKKVDFFGEITTYVRQIEEYKLVQTGPQSAYPFYSNLTEILRERMSDDKVKVIESCPNITNPSRFIYCYDSIITDYGGRKTLKHESANIGASASRREHYVQGLGQALFYVTAADGGYDEISLRYYSKNGQTWGSYDSTIVKELRKMKPLTVREVYDFNLGDIFIYEHKLYAPPLVGTLRTQYERRTILSKTMNTKGDSIIYTYNSERFFKDSLRKASERIDTLIVTDLDSVAINKFKPNPSSGFKTYASDTYLSFCIDRKLNTRHLFCDNCDYGMDFWVGQGVGVTYMHVLSFSPTESRLIYFKKKTETWGTPIDFPVGINTPSVSTPKITLSPNPTSDILTIDTDIIFNKLRIINTNGQLVLEEKNVQSINTAQLPNGIYFLQVFEGSILRG